MRRITSEFLGSFLLALAVVGSGAFAVSLTDDGGLRLLINALVTAGILILIITLLNPLSGAHFNPAVSLVAFLKKELTTSEVFQYILSQIAGGITGVITANFLFNLTIVSSKSISSIEFSLFISEVVATAGLLFVIRHLINEGKFSFMPFGVSLWIFAGYFFTPSASVANPAMTLGRALTDSYAGISSGLVLPYLAAQVIGALLGLLLAESLSKRTKNG